MLHRQILNQRNLVIDLVVCIPAEPKGVAYIAHGFGGWKQQPYIKTIHEALFEQNYVTVRWDASDRDVRQVKASNYYQDLEVVIEWGSKQSWHVNKFMVAGHSLGGLVAGTYAARRPEAIEAVVLAASAIGPDSVEAALNSPEFKQWINKFVGKFKIPRTVVRFLTRQFAKDLQRFDLVKDAKSLTMPVLMIGGVSDTVVPVVHQQKLFAAIPSTKKELHIVPNLSHDVHPYDLKVTVKRIISDFAARY